MDISRTAIKEYIDHFPDRIREEVANIICDGEAFVNAFDTEYGKVLLDVLSAQYAKYIRDMLSLVRDGKYEDAEELRRIRQHCISINQIFAMIRDWDSRIKQLRRHMDNLQ